MGVIGTAKLPRKIIERIVQVVAGEVRPITRLRSVGDPTNTDAQAIRGRDGRNGHDADLVLGARTLFGPLEAHAWVELEGEVLNDGPHVRHIYEPFDLRGVAARPGSG